MIGEIIKKWKVSRTYLWKTEVFNGNCSFSVVYIQLQNITLVLITFSLYNLIQIFSETTAKYLLHSNSKYKHITLITQNMKLIIL